MVPEIGYINCSALQVTEGFDKDVVDVVVTKSIPPKKLEIQKHANGSTLQVREAERIAPHVYFEGTANQPQSSSGTAMAFSFKELNPLYIPEVAFSSCVIPY
ncbi:hypothetical protein CEXT_612351 [Caerostris extrusa]|uniref:Uncharacterized protein n=1 Tax=Caerostris extrusa TaxID=172846 RepID=A0AAV4PR08_CAEEX|nr:hypothetical protein CEXT_612351 [Caerostris extrusa]